MNRRILIAVAACAASTVPVAAQAMRLTERTGSFAAMGTGTLQANGSFTDVFGAKLQGTLIVRDPAGDAKVLIDGVRQRPKRVHVGARIVRVYTVRRPGGFAFHVKGRNVRITLKSPDSTMSVQMFGRGTVTRLDGEGTYTLNDDPPADWTAAPLPINIKPPRPLAPLSVATSLAA